MGAGREGDAGRRGLVGPVRPGTGGQEVEPLDQGAVDLEQERTVLAEAAVGVAEVEVVVAGLLDRDGPLDEVGGGDAEVGVAGAAEAGIGRGHGDRAAEQGVLGLQAGGDRRRRRGRHHVDVVHVRAFAAVGGEADGVGAGGEGQRRGEGLFAPAEPAAGGLELGLPDDGPVDFETQRAVFAETPVAVAEHQIVGAGLGDVDRPLDRVGGVRTEVDVTGAAEAGIGGGDAHGAFERRRLGLGPVFGRSLFDDPAADEALTALTEVHIAVWALFHKERATFWRQFEQLTDGVAVVGVDRVDGVGDVDVDEEVVALDIRRVDVTLVDGGGADDAVDLDRRDAGGVREGAIGRGDDQLARLDGGVEILRAGLITVAGGGQELAAVAALEQRPAEVSARGAAVDLLPGKPAGVRDEQLAVVVEVDPERVAQAELIDLRSVGVRIAVVERVVGQAGAGLRVDPQNLAGEEVCVLDVERALVVVVEGGAVTDRDVERAVGAEGQAAADVRARVHLPEVLARLAGVRVDVGGRVGLDVLEERIGIVERTLTGDVVEGLRGAADQDLLAFWYRHRRAAGQVDVEGDQPVEAVAVAVGARVAGVVGHTRRVDGVGEVHLRVFRKVRMQHEVDQPAVTRAVHLIAEVDEVRQEGLAGGVVDPDGAALRGDHDDVGVAGQPLHRGSKSDARNDNFLARRVDGLGHRRRRWRQRRFVVDNEDIAGARRAHRVARHGDERNAEDLGLRAVEFGVGVLGESIVENRDFDEGGRFAGGDRNGPAGADEILPDRGARPRDVVGDVGRRRQVARTNQFDADAAGGFVDRDVGVHKGNRHRSRLRMRLERQGVNAAPFSRRLNVSSPLVFPGVGRLFATRRSRRAPSSGVR